ncbi:MAG TPA: glycosyltransferase family A protein [Sedimentisphaerales bacterium]|nr:glycosyltransferase family A protein [Sedimentisphaerales bacterium]
MAQNRPKVSVIIPLYNKAAYIGRALDSVFSQTYQDFEIVVVDDGSADNGPRIVKEYRDSRLRLIRQYNKGPGAARNKGTAESCAELLAFLDADDEWMPRFLEKSLHTLENNADCQLTACTYFLGKQRIDVSPILEGRGIKEGPWRLRADISFEELRHVMEIFNSPCIVCKRCIIDKYGGFYSRYGCNYGEDYYLWLQVMLNHKVYRILEPLVWYHTEASQMGPGRAVEHPLEPFLTDPDAIRRNCCRQSRKLLELWLARFAMATAHKAATQYGNTRRARYLAKKFPLMKKWPWEYFKLRFKIMFPGLIGPVRSLKGLWRPDFSNNTGISQPT